MTAYCLLLCLLFWLAYTSTSTTPTPTTFSKTLANHESEINYYTRMKLEHIKTNAEKHARFDRTRQRLKWRLSMAAAAEWNWPSTRARCEVMRIEEEMRRLDLLESRETRRIDDVDYSCAF